MRKPDRPPSRLHDTDDLARSLDDFDYSVETDDFVLYELTRLIEEDRASFEDEEFRRIVDEGIRIHIEERLSVRAEMAMRIRVLLPGLAGPTLNLARRTVQALENVESSLRNSSLLVRLYTAYLFRRLEDAADLPFEAEGDARTVIARWRAGEVSRDETMKRLNAIGRPSVGPLADLLLEMPEDRAGAELAIETLAAIRSSSSARVLAHAIAEPLLDEELEMKAYQYTRLLWPLSRHYILYSLRSHAHEDLSFRWFQILVECDELNAVDLIIDEVIIHAGDTVYHEDLKAILELLRLSHDPEVEQKLVAVLNAEDTSSEAAKLLQAFAANFQPPTQPSDNPWARAVRLSHLNEQYTGATRLLDSGKREEAHLALTSILKQDSSYPLAVRLKQFLEASR